MTKTTAPGGSAPKPFLKSKAFLFFAAIWVLSMLSLFIGDANTAYLALSSLGYSLLLAGLVHWLIPRSNATDDAFDASHPRSTLLARTAVVSSFLAINVLFGFAMGGVSHGIQVPLLTPFFVKLFATRMPLHDSYSTYFNFAYLALIPGGALLLLRLQPSALGLKASARGTGRALAACMVVPVIICSMALFHGKTTLLGLLLLAIHNLFSNGFSEEFSCRGILLSHFRAYMSVEWALVLQAIAFALIHAGGTVAEEHWNPILISANVLALNMPIALTLGFIAIRSRSLLLPSAVHVSLDTMGRLVGAM